MPDCPADVHRVVDEDAVVDNDRVIVVNRVDPEENLVGSAQ